MAITKMVPEVDRNKKDCFTWRCVHEFFALKAMGYVVLKVVHSTVCGVVQEMRVIVFNSSFVMCTTNTVLRKKNE